MLLQIPTINCRFTSKSHFQTPPFFRSFVHAHRPRTTALRSRGTPLAPAQASCYTLSFPPCMHTTPCVHTAVNVPATVACMQRPAMTAKGRTILLNKVDTANGNVGIRCLLAGINGIAFSFRSLRVPPLPPIECIRVLEFVTRRELLYYTRYDDLTIKII